MTEENTAYEEALRLSQGKYLLPNIAHAKENNAMLVEINYQAKTNAHSTYPIVGTCALDCCTGIAIYNKKTQEALVDHQAVLFPSQFERHVSDMRSNDNEPLEVHVIGVANDPDHSDDFAFLMSKLADLTTAIAGTPNVILKTFDVGDKPHPGDFAIDARNGRLIRGTSDITRSALHEDVERYIDDWEVLQKNFDGTSSEYQNPSHVKK